MIWKIEFKSKLHLDSVFVYYFASLEKAIFLKKNFYLANPNSEWELGDTKEVTMYELLSIKLPIDFSKVHEYKIKS